MLAVLGVSCVQILKLFLSSFAGCLSCSGADCFMLNFSKFSMGYMIMAMNAFFRFHDTQYRNIYRDSHLVINTCAAGPPLPVE